MFDALEAELKRALDLSFDALTTPERLALLQRRERLRRCLPSIEHPLINQIGEQADEMELGGRLPLALANGSSSPAAKHRGASMRPPTSASAKRLPAGLSSRCYPPPPKRSAVARSGRVMSP